MTAFNADGSTVLITGANSGIGKDLARQLAMTGRYRKVLLGCRDARRGEAARAALRRRTGLDMFDVVTLDLSDAAAVRRAVGRLAEPVDDLVMNAGGFGGADPFAMTRDGVVEIIATNVLGHAALLDGLLAARLLRRSAVLAGSEAARGVKLMGIKRPVLEDGSVAEFIAVRDGSRFKRDRVDMFGAYAWAKFVGALWIGHMARCHPGMRLLTMSPGGTSGTAGMDVLPQPMRFIVNRIMGPFILPLMGMGHRLETGAKRMADAVLDERFQSGTFYASRRRTTGELADQAALFPALGDAVVQGHAAAALEAFLTRSAGFHA